MLIPSQAPSHIFNSPRCVVELGLKFPPPRDAAIGVFQRVWRSKTCGVFAAAALADPLPPTIRKALPDGLAPGALAKKGAAQLYTKCGKGWVRQAPL